MITENNLVKRLREMQGKMKIYPFVRRDIYLEDDLVILYKNWLKKACIPWERDREPCIPIGKVGPSIVFGHYLKEKLLASDWSHALFQHAIIPEKQYRDILNHLGDVWDPSHTGEGPKGWENVKVNSKEDFLENSNPYRNN